MTRRFTDEERIRVYTERRRQYIGEIHFYLVAAHGFSEKDATRMIDSNIAIVDGWLKELKTRKSDRDLEPAINPVVAARILSNGLT